MAVNPLEISKIVELIAETSRKKYERYWKLFCFTKEISQENPATTELVFEFLKECRDMKNYAPTTLWTVFSCLNKFCQHLYEYVEVGHVQNR